MRIIAGSLRSRLFAGLPPGKSQPMSERARTALFNRLGDLTGLQVVDAFAGTGALAFEAVSRGAVQADCIEANRRTYQILVANRDRLGLNNAVNCYLQNISRYLNHRADPFLEAELVLADPPYNDFKNPLIGRLGLAVKPGSRLVLSWPDHWQPAQALFLADWDCLNQSRYARANIGLFSKKSQTKANRANILALLEKQNRSG